MAEIFDIELDEVSLVSKPANGKKFVVYKSEDVNESQEQSGEEAKVDKEATDDEVEKKKASEKVLNAVKEALAILKSVKRSLPKELVSAYHLFENYLDSEGEDVGYGYPEPSSKALEDIVKKVEEIHSKVEKVSAKVAELELTKKEAEVEEQVVKIDSNDKWPSLSSIFGGI